MDKLLKIKKALKITPYESLYELAYAKEEKPINRPEKVVKTETPLLDVKQEIMLSSDAIKLGYDIAQILASVYKERGERLGISMRRLKKAKEELVSHKMVLEVWVGNLLFLAPTDLLYKHLQLCSPYKRDISTGHSFLTLVTQALIKPDPQIHKTGIEVPVNTTGRTGDLIAYLKNGGRWAYEITLSSSNVTENAAKFRNKGFSKIIFVCRDDQLRRSVQTILRDADFEPDFFATIECTIFSVLMKDRKRSTRKGKRA